MKPVFQTKFPPQHPHGNCLAAVVATLLDRTIEDVPNFEVIQLGMPGLWRHVLTEWLSGKGQDLMIQQAPTNLRNYHTNGGKFPAGYINVPYIAYGEVGGQQHVAIYANGRLVHDPTPKGAGLDTFNELWIMRRIKTKKNGGLDVMSWYSLDVIHYSTVPQPADY